MTRIAAVVFAVFALGVSLLLHYYLPREALVSISGIDSKRAEGIPTRGDNEAEQRTLDVYFLYVHGEDNKPQIYRNENTAWGWPPYFKFDAAELQAKAQGMSGQKVLIRYYGWRNKLLNIFPNIVSFEAAASSKASVPLGRYIGYGLWAFVLILILPRYMAIFSDSKRRG